MSPGIFKHTSAKQGPFWKPKIIEIDRRNTNNNSKTIDLGYIEMSEVYV
jgi:hypothetical protein